jgi:hypothetical protein
LAFRSWSKDLWESHEKLPFSTITSPTSKLGSSSMDCKKRVIKGGYIKH